MTRYLLPDLSYDYGALEPHIAARVMELHHDKHHRKYVDSANEVSEQIADARQRGDYSHIAALERELAFHVSGHVLHSIFWQNLSPEGGGRPSGHLETDLNRDFGSFDMFKVQLVRTAESILGCGWAALVFDPVSRRLAVLQIQDHQSQTIQGAVPLLVLDAWEHAYYLQYHTDKATFFENVWHLWNWDDVAERYALALRLDMALEDATDEAIIVAESAESAERPQPAAGEAEAQP